MEQRITVSDETDIECPTCAGTRPPAEQVERWTRFHCPDCDALCIVHRDSHTRRHYWKEYRR